MRKYRITFCAREMNEVGQFKNYSVIIKARNGMDARKQFYFNYEEAQILNVKEIE